MGLPADRSWRPCWPTDADAPASVSAWYASAPVSLTGAPSSRYPKKSVIAFVSSEKAQRSVTWPFFMW